MLSYPPALLPLLYSAHLKQRAQLRLEAMTDTLMAGESDWGTTSKYVGKAPLPKSDYEYSNAELTKHLMALQRAAGHTPAEVDQLQADREAWKRLREARRVQA